jgi:transcriptional regulator with XRE-family HTH domain
MEIICNLLGLRIKRLREANGKTQFDLATISNMSLKNIGELERGRGNPSLKSLAKLSEALGVSLADLFDFELEEKSDALLKHEIQHRLQHAKTDVLRLLHRALKP